MGYYKILIRGYMQKADFLQILSRCEVQEDGKKYKLLEGNVKELWVNQAHIGEVKTMLSRLNVKPEINIIEDAKSEIEVSTENREKMPLTINISEEGVNVIDSYGKEMFVPLNNIDAIWQILKVEKAIAPRRIWAKLVEVHKLFPELDEAIEVIRNADIEQAKKDLILNALYEYRASAFEGRRAIKKGQENLNYYVLYWYPILTLKRLGLVDQKRGIKLKEIFLTEKGTATEDWRTVASEYKQSLEV